MESLVLEYRTGTFPALEAAVLGALDAGASRVVLDLDALTSLDVEGVRELISLLRRSRAQGGEIALRVSKPDILQTLQVTALDRIFPVIAAEAA